MKFVKREISMKNAKKTILRVFMLVLVVGLAVVLAACGNGQTATPAPGIYTPGTYTATAQGMGTVTVKVTVDANSITDVELDVSNETADIGQAAADTLKQQVMDAQSAEIDGVAGATMTSTAVKTAVADCLSQAKTDSAAVTPEPTASGETTDVIQNGENADNYRNTLTQDYLDEITALQTEYAPKVTTLPNGVQIQRTPTEYTHHAEGYLGDLAYNNYRLDADNRGCNACHENLSDLVQNMKVLHVQVEGDNHTAINVMQCLDCHIRFDYYLSSTTDNGNDIRQFGTLIHGIHYNSNVNFTGNCFSCHNASEDGNGMQLWDDVKYEVLHGITDISADDIQSMGLTFNYDQTTIFPASQDDFHIEEWWWDNSNDNIRHDAIVTGETGEEAYGPRDDWEINVHGHVAQPQVLKLGDIISSAEKDGAVVHDIFKFHCTADMMGASMIANVNVTAIPLTYVYDMCGGLVDGANWARATTYDSFYTDHSIDRGGYLVYEINGEPLTPGNGYPALVWVPTGSCGQDVKCTNDIYVGTEDEKEDMWFYEYLGLDTDPSGYTNKPNVSLLNLEDGQIIDAYTPFTIEGFADAYEQHIDHIDVSFDRGLTWTTLNVGDTNTQMWVHWTLELPPLDTGAYVMYFNVFTKEGLEANRLIKYMINVK